MQLFKQIQDNLSFRKCLFDMVFNVTYNTDSESYKSMINRYNLSSKEFSMAVEPETKYNIKNKY